ncbi:hypothetical protein SA5R_18575 [Pantoea dispersa]|uniref:Uncharacterized protein n=2 Tax=Pantoea dispersa TaxID=59814 RepID=A0A8E1S113_9GAMM|nr:hypothetical protein SA2_10780 [Pantoea dispersa]KTS22221.1 hypothetical protein SA4R_11200 [Pantoea dispersa]KTS57163.1 hypothetical protein SA5R_18575 [Pantoea dispersa]KTS68478.1 hypothetical protein SA3R_07185 [Pantoea dispersa]
MDVQAYRVAVRLALDDQLTRNLLQVSRDAIELNKKFVAITRNIKALTSAAREATSALRALNRSLNNEFSGASRGAREYAGAIRDIADQTQRMNRVSRNVPLLAGSYGAAMTLPVLAAGAAAAGGSGGYGNPGGRPALPSPSGQSGWWHGWHNGMPPGGWGGGGSGHGGNGRPPGGGSFSEGMTNMATGYFGFRLLKGFVDEAARYQTMTEKLRQFGMGQAATEEALRIAETTRVRGSSATDMLKYLVEAQGVFSESGRSSVEEQLRAAKLAAPVLARINFASRGLDEHQREATTAKQMDMLRFTETAGGLKSPERFNELMDAAFRAIQSSGGNVDFTQYRQFMAKAGTSAFNLSNKALFAELEPIIGELKGSAAGDALMTAYNRLNGIIKLPNQVTHDLMTMGIWDASKIELNSLGGVKRFRGNPLINAQLFSQSPVEYYENVILPLYRRHHYTEEQKQRENALIFGRTGGKMFSLIDKQLETIHHRIDAYGIARGLNDAYVAVGGTYNGKAIDFHKKWQNLQRVIGKDGGLLDTFTQGLDTLTHSLQQMADIAHRHPEMAKFAGQAAMAVTGLAGISGGLWVIKHAAGALLTPLKLAGWGIDLLIGRSATTGLTGLTAALTGLPGIISAVTLAALYPGSTVSQSREMAERDRLARQDARDNGVTYKPWMPSQADFDRQHAREQTYRKTGQYPPIPPVTGGQSLQPVNLLMTHEGRQVLVATVMSGISKQAARAPASTSNFDPTMLMVYPGQAGSLSLP